MAITKNLVNIGNAGISGDLTAATFKKRNGTNKQILLADGTTKDMGMGTTTFLRNDGTWATPPIGSDIKQKILASTEKIYLTGVKSTTTTSEGFANANVYMLNGGLVASSLSVTTATISTLNGSSVPNSPKFTDTVYTHPGKTQSDTTSTAKPSHGGSFTVVDGVTRDSLGHVSGINVKTVTLPGSGNTDTKQTVTPSADKVYLTGVASLNTTSVGYTNGNVYMLNGGLVASSLSVSNATISGTANIYTATISTLNGSTVPNSPKFTDTVYTHPTITATTTTSTASLKHSGTFTVVTSVTTNTNGHVTKIGTKLFTLPDSGNTDIKQSITPSKDKVYLTGVTTTGSITSVGYSNASVYMLDGELNASTLKARNLSVPTASITTANILTLNGKTVGNDPQFTDTKYTHPTKTQSDTTSTAKPSHGGSFTVVDGVTRDGLGHVSGINVKTVTLPGSGNTDTKQTVTPSADKVYLTGVTSTSITGVGYANGNVYMLDGNLNALGLSVSTINGKTVGNNPKFTDTVYTHPSKTQSDTTSTAKPSHGGSFTVVDSVTRDGLGHVSGINVKTVTLPGSGNTDEKVKVNTSTTTSFFPLMAVNSTGPTNGGTYGAIYDTGITMSPYTHLLSVSGKVNAASGFFQTSDINKKNIIGDLDLDKAYDLIDKCQTILYTLKDDDSDKELIGLIAQEVKEFFPELITEDNDGALSLDYSRLTVVILKVLKDIINRIKILESK